MRGVAPVLLGLDHFGATLDAVLHCPRYVYGCGFRGFTATSVVPGVSVRRRFRDRLPPSVPARHADDLAIRDHETVRGRDVAATMLDALFERVRRRPHGVHDHARANVGSVALLTATARRRDAPRSTRDSSEPTYSPRS